MINSKRHITQILVFCPALFFCYICNASIRLPALFGDHMVLQQKTKVRLWGWGSPDEEIFVEASWQKATVHTKVDRSGNWKVDLGTPKAGGPYKITFRGVNSIYLSDVLIGEVWLCSGQSNMTFPLKYSDGAKQEIEKADLSFIRYFGVQHQYGTAPFEDCKGQWQITSPQTAPSFSAVAYYFAKKIYHHLKVPVGIVCSGWAGTPAEAWTPRTVLEKDDALHYFLKRWKEIPDKVGADSVKYRLAVQQWEEQNKFRHTDLPKPEEPRNYYYYSKSWCEPGALFNGMVNPVIPFSFKGVLWFQGESNVSEYNLYQTLFTALIESWRKRWNDQGRQQILPFYFVQIAPYGYGNLDAAARLRQAQYDVMKTVDHTGMAVTIDLGDMNNIHFTHKKQVGDRLALIALAKSYGCKNLVYEGPECIQVFKAGGRLKLRFNEPLFTPEKEKPNGFEIGYRDPGSGSIQFVKAESTIKGNEVMVWNEAVKDPSAVRYGWLESGEANLGNRSGLPAFPFRRKVK